MATRGRCHPGEPSPSRPAETIAGRSALAGSRVVPGPHAGLLARGRLGGRLRRRLGARRGRGIRGRGCRRRWARSRRGRRPTATASTGGPTATAAGPAGPSRDSAAGSTAARIHGHATRTGGTVAGAGRTAAAEPVSGRLPVGVGRPERVGGHLERRWRQGRERARYRSYLGRQPVSVPARLRGPGRHGGSHDEAEERDEAHGTCRRRQAARGRRGGERRDPAARDAAAPCGPSAQVRLRFEPPTDLGDGERDAEHGERDHERRHHLRRHAPSCTRWGVDAHSRRWTNPCA